MYYYILTIFQGDNYIMKKLKNILCYMLAFMMAVSVAALSPKCNASAAANTQNNIILSTANLSVSEGGISTFTAALPVGYDATRLSYAVADNSVVSVAPVAYAANVAGFSVSYVNGGSTVVAIYNIDNPTMVAYLTVNASNVIMDIPAKLGTNKSNYCVLTSYEFVPYDYTYENFNDYKYTLNIKYTCTSYKDTDYNNWGCYGYFYDANGNAIKKVHLFAGTVTKGTTYHSEFNVPVNAVKFSIEGFN
jgi:hypothetical protein